MTKTITEEEFAEIEFKGRRIDKLQLSAYKDCNGNATTLAEFSFSGFDFAFPLTALRLYSLQVATLPVFPEKLIFAYDPFFDDAMEFFALSILNRSFEQFDKTQEFLRILFTKSEIEVCAAFPVKVFVFKGFASIFAKEEAKAGEPTSYYVIEEAAQENERDLAVITSFVENSEKMKDSIGEVVKSNLDSPVCAYYYQELRGELKHWKHTTYKVISCLQVFEQMLAKAIDAIEEARKYRVKVEDRELTDLAPALAEKEQEIEDLCAVVRSYYEDERAGLLSIYETTESEGCE